MDNPGWAGVDIRSGQRDERPKYRWKFASKIRRTMFLWQCALYAKLLEENSKLLIREWLYYRFPAAIGDNHVPNNSQIVIGGNNRYGMVRIVMAENQILRPV